MDSKWISVDHEMPPCDGLYEITNSPNSVFVGLASYNGFGFMVKQSYVDTNFWRETLPKEKVYGKISKR
jgi:hypothetical protein